MQTHLAALANQVTDSHSDVKHLKDTVFIQKVSALPRAKDLNRNPEKQGGKVCLQYQWYCSQLVFDR